jgi:hypothetical protein
MKISLVWLVAGLSASTAAFAEPVKVFGTVADVFGHRFVIETEAGKVLVDIGPKGADKVAIKRGEKIEIEGDRKESEIRARRVTLADGHAYEVSKPGATWREWLTGARPPETPGPCRIEERQAFGEAEAKKLASDNGYQLTSDPVATKRHFRATATKGGKPYEIDLHRDGKIVEQTLFGPAEANKLVTEKGYELVGELRPVDKHFELLGKLDGKFYELHAHRNGKLVRARTVDATDPKWGSMVR